MTVKAEKSITSSGKITLLIFSMTLFLSASLMFAIQPMAGKMLLPLIGGTPAGWIVAMAFFQVMLLIGYLFAHTLSCFRPLIHGAIYVAALAAGIYFMPMVLAHHTGKISSNPGAWDIFKLLSYTMAVPFIALSATSSTIQRLFTTSGHKSSGDPYFLYVASNIGSFAGLLLYPALIEPNFTLSAQSHYAGVFYCFLLGAAAICLLLARKGIEPQTVQSRETAPVNARQYFEWMLLAFVPSSLLSGVTIYITTDIMSVPMIWVLPLSLYLLTFVIAFSNKPLIPFSVLEKITPWLVFAAIVCIGIYKFNWLSEWIGIVFYLTVFFTVALSCHMVLASRRPLDSNRKHLTGFYLMMSVGGAVGGVLIAFVIPVVAERMVELPLILVFSLLLHPAISLKSVQAKLILAALLVVIPMIGLTPPQFYLDKEITLRFSLIAVFMLLAFGLLSKRASSIMHRRNLMAATAMLFVFSQFTIDSAQIMLSERNFYGVIRVYEADLTVMRSPQSVGEKKPETFKMRYLGHGTTIHGLQILEPEKYRNMPIGYFSKAGPLGDIFEEANPKDVAIIGLGAGVMSCYSAPDRRFTYIEIDKDMAEAAKKYFSFINECTSAAPPEIIIGDGRLELKKLGSRKFDMIMIDAFSSDSIPTHLLTKEAIQEYLNHLNPDGVIVFHLSNRFFYLETLFPAISAELGLQNRYINNPYADIPFLFASKWMVLARPARDMSAFSEDKKWISLSKTTVPYWTDDYTNIMSVIHIEPPETATYWSKQNEQ